LEYQIPLAPLPEQRRIVARIEDLAAKIEEARGLRRRVVDETDALLNAALYRLFGSAEHGVAGKQPISKFSTILRGRGPIYMDGSGKLAINQKCVRWEGIDTTHAKEVSDAWVHSIPVQFLLQEDDVVVNSTGEGTIGRACVVSPNAIGLAFDSHVLVVRPERDMLLPSYFAYFVKSPIGQAAIEDTKGAKTTKQTELGTAKLGDISLPVPPLLEQRRVVAYLDRLQAKVDSLNRLQAETVAELDAMLPSFLHKAFKGYL
jgi:restriction endonuclease S subunit